MRRVGLGGILAVVAVGLAACGASGSRSSAIPLGVAQAPAAGHTCASAAGTAANAMRNGLVCWDSSSLSPFVAATDVLRAMRTAALRDVSAHCVRWRGRVFCKLSAETVDGGLLGVFVGPEAAKNGRFGRGAVVRGGIDQTLPVLPGRGTPIAPPT